jgi:hypothetical protein
VRRQWALKGLAFVVFAAAAAAALGFVVLGLWNELIPGLFGGPVLTFWQAAGLLVLSRILFGGFRARHGWRQRHWRGRWDRMTPEERERLREGFRQRGFRGCHEQSGT